MTRQVTIDLLRKIVEDKAYEEIKFPDVDYTQTPEEVEEEITQYGGKIKGTIIDLQTANVLVTVYDKLIEENPKHQEKFDKLLKTYTGFEKLVKFAWSCVK